MYPKYDLLHILWLVTFCFTCFPNFSFGQQITFSPDSSVFMEKGTLVVGMEQLQPTNTKNSSTIYLQSDVQLVDADKEVKANVSHKKTTSLFTKKTILLPKKSELPTRVSKEENPTVEIIKSPISSSHFIVSKAMSTLAVLSSIGYSLSIHQSVFVFLLLIFYFLCLFFGHRIFNISLPFFKVSKVRPPPVF